MFMTVLSNLAGITNAFADAAPAAAAAATPQQGLMSMLPLFGILMVFMYFMIIRPQAKRAKAQKALIQELKKGTEVIIAGGIIGKIEKMTDDFIVVEIADKVSITVQKNAIVGCLPKGTLKSV